MQNVSRKWEYAHTQLLLPESYVEIDANVGDPSAQSDAVATDNDHSWYSETKYVTYGDMGVPMPYVTLDQNAWVLNGGMQLLTDMSDSESHGYVGYMGGTLSDDEGWFDNPPVLTLEFSEKHTEVIPGITITWGEAHDEYALEFQIEIYSGGRRVDSEYIMDNTSVKSFVPLNISGYDQIEVTIYRWCLSRRRAKITNIYLGLNQVFTKNDLLSYRCTQTVDPVSTSLPQTTVTFNIADFEGNYDPENTNGLYKYLRESQSINVRMGYKLDNSVEWINGGKLYLSELKYKPNDNSLEFIVKDAWEHMQQIYYEDSSYDPSQKRSLRNLAVSVLSKITLPSKNEGYVDYYLDDSLGSIYTTAPLPTDTLANCLQLIANAGCCVFYVSRDGTIRIEKLGRRDICDVMPYNSLARPELTDSKICSAIEMNVYSYSSDPSQGLMAGSALVEGSDDTPTTVKVTIPHSEPIVGAYTNIPEEYGARVRHSLEQTEVEITFTGALAIIEVYGTPFATSSALYRLDVGEKGDAIKVDNPLVTSSEMAKNVAEWMKEYYVLQEKISCTWRNDPRLDCFDYVDVSDKHYSKLALVTKLDYSYEGAFRGTVEGVVVAE